MNQLSCNSCGSALEVDGFDRRLAVVHCSHCGVMYDLTKPRNTANVSEAEVAGDAARFGGGSTTCGFLVLAQRLVHCFAGLRLFLECDDILISQLGRF